MSPAWIAPRSTMMGEPGTRSSADVAAVLMPGQPWGDVRGMGNRLRHGYDRVSVPIIRHAIQDELPALEIEVRQSLARLQSGASHRMNLERELSITSRLCLHRWHLGSDAC